MGEVIRRENRGIKRRGVMEGEVSTRKAREVVGVREVGLVSVRKVGIARGGSLGKIRVKKS